MFSRFGVNCLPLPFVVVVVAAAAAVVVGVVVVIVVVIVVVVWGVLHVWLWVHFQCWFRLLRVLFCRVGCACMRDLLVQRFRDCVQNKLGVVFLL